MKNLKVPKNSYVFKKIHAHVYMGHDVIHLFSLDPQLTKCGLY